MKEYRRICVSRNGYAMVEASSDDEALSKAASMQEDDFDWEPVDQDLLLSAEVVDVIEE